MSLEKKVSLGMFAVFSGAGCANENISADLGGITIYEAVTDSEGKAYFTEEETGEEVEVALNPPVSDATILYFDNSLSEGFMISHASFSPQLNIALHNSSHEYGLTPAPLPVLHDGFQKEKSKSGAETYLSWAEANWEHTGCFNRENMLTLMKAGVYLTKKLGIVETIGFSEKHLDNLAKYLEDNLPESAVAEVYVFTPYKYGFRGTTTITALDVKLDGKCTYSENGETENNENNDCPGMIFCDEFKGTSLNTSKWNIVNDSGIEVYGGWLSLPSASSVAAKNQFDNYCTDKRVDLRTNLYAGSVFFGNMGLSAANDQGVLSCGSESIAVNTTGAENGLSLYKKEGYLSLQIGGMVSSIPCADEIRYVQLTAGLNDIVDFDYVRVKCE